MAISPRDCTQFLYDMDRLKSVTADIGATLVSEGVKIGESRE
jgi:hypothetical protein